mgnify:FL=1
MVKSIPRPVRLSLLAITLGGALLVLGKAVATPKGTENATPDYQFPQTVAIAGWQPTASEPIKPEASAPPAEPPAEATKEPPGHSYQYRQGSTSVDVQIRYMTGDGDVNRFLFVYSPVRAANAYLQIKHQPGMGFYGLVSHQGKAYLSACVNPRGESTVTEQQFRQNTYKSDLQVGRILPWLMEQAPLFDRRCLWTLMSTPLPASATSDPTVSETAYKTLESLWFPWLKQWQSQFPPA